MKGLVGGALKLAVPNQLTIGCRRIVLGPHLLRKQRQDRRCDFGDSPGKPPRLGEPPGMSGAKSCRFSVIFRWADI
jgi:hypothetical protein